MSGRVYDIYDGRTLMFYNAKEDDLKISTGMVHYITFGKGDKPLVMFLG
jgi:hypothetical protein